jgi:tol-pal system protein YbgF
MKKAILLAGVLSINAWSALTQAQVQVIEPGAAQGNSGGSAGAAAGNNDLLVSLYNQLEALQQEVQTLRGIVEEQSNRVRRLETETRDRYLDMDSRLSALSAGAVPAPVDIEGAAALNPDVVSGAAAAPRTGSSGDVRTSVPFTPAVPDSDRTAASTPADQAVSSDAPALAAAAPATAAMDPVIAQMSEPDLYRTALNLLLEEGKSDESAAMFDAYLQRFPDGRLLPNALYWQGEALVLLSRYPEAQTAFERVLKEFPADAKAAGAMLKTGVVQNLQGNRSEAERIWRELPARFPDSPSEITLARDYLSRP